MKSLSMDIVKSSIINILSRICMMDLENIFDDELSDSHSVSNMHRILLTEYAMTTYTIVKSVFKLV